MIKKILIANRGEIACRVIRTCKRLGIATVAVYSEADANCQHVQLADQAVLLGESDSRKSYLNIDKIIRAAKKLRCDAIHPGYGFLSENAAFADRLKKEQIIFIGPNAKVMRALGDKIAAKKLALKAKVPLVPGLLSDKKSLSQMETEVQTFAKKAGFPILIKAAAGGGGRGMRRVDRAAELHDAIASAQREALAAFGDGRLFVEKYVEGARHVEVQILADLHGNVLSLYDRDCSMQRNHQKVIEEAPAPNIPEKVRNKLHACARDLCKKADYANAGTVEFLYDNKGAFYFLEVNSRLQVEHPVTEAILGLDLVELQIRVAEGLKLPTLLKQNQIVPHGTAIECRICAEIPEQNFIASTGVLELLEFGSCSDGGLPVRVDSGFVSGDKVTHYYDSLLAKLVVHRTTRQTAIEAATEALTNTAVCGLKSNTAFLLRLLSSPEFREVRHSIHFAQISLESAAKLQAELEFVAAQYLCFQIAYRAPKQLDSWQRNSSWRIHGPSIAKASVSLGGVACYPCVESLPDNSYRLSGDKLAPRLIKVETVDQTHLHFTFKNSTERLGVHCTSSGVWVQSRIGNFHIQPNNPVLKTHSKESLAANTVLSPLPGKIVAIKVNPGAELNVGDAILVLESMKMEHIIRAPNTSKVDRILVKCGDIVEAQSVLAHISSI